MGIVVEFPADLAARRVAPDVNAASRGRTATIVILPAIRIERYTEESSGASDGRVPENPSGVLRRTATLTPDRDV